MSGHPAVAAVRRGVRLALADVPAGAVVMVACSGGADSLALLAGTVAEARREGWRVVGVTVDHDLQPGSGERAEQVMAAMAGLGADETTTVRLVVDASGQGIEAAARESRYSALTSLASEYAATAVLLGHTRDDQAETVLLGLARGSGGRSIAGMRRAFHCYRRPLLDLARADTVAACEALGIEFWSDPHNEDPRFARARVRHRLLPALEAELGPGIAETLARTADQLREDVDYLDDVAARVLAGLADPLPVTALAELPTAIRRRVLRLAAVRAGARPAELFREHVLAVDALITDWRGQKWVDLPGPVRAARRDGVLRFGPAEGADAP